MQAQDIGYGLSLNRVSGSEKLFTMTGPNTKAWGWRAVYLGYNSLPDLTRFYWSRYNRLMPLAHQKQQFAKRLKPYGFNYELKISNGYYPSIFWGDQGKQLLKDLAVFLEQPEAAKQLPKIKSVIYPFKVGDAIQVWINGEYAVSVSNHPEELEFVTQLQAYRQCKPDVIIQAIKTFQLPEKSNAVSNHL